MSAFVRLTDSSRTSRHVRFVPKGDVGFPQSDADYTCCSGDQLWLVSRDPIY
jgi:hypothetical protein